MACVVDIDCPLPGQVCFNANRTDWVLACNRTSQCPFSFCACSSAPDLTGAACDVPHPSLYVEAVVQAIVFIVSLGLLLVIVLDLRTLRKARISFLSSNAVHCFILAGAAQVANIANSAATCYCHFTPGALTAVSPSTSRTCPLSSLVFSGLWLFFGLLMLVNLTILWVSAYESVLNVLGTPPWWSKAYVVRAIRVLEIFYVIVIALSLLSRSAALMREAQLPFGFIVVLMFIGSWSLLRGELNKIPTSTENSPNRNVITATLSTIKLAALWGAVTVLLFMVAAVLGLLFLQGVGSAAYERGGWSRPQWWVQLCTLFIAEIESGIVVAYLHWHIKSMTRLRHKTTQQRAPNASGTDSGKDKLNGSAQPAASTAETAVATLPLDLLE
jgi:hypothetical protein